jgi:hypothetical protein
MERRGRLVAERQGAWTPVPGQEAVPGTGAAQTVTETATLATQRFYRVVELP